MKGLKLGVIGVGSMGKNHARIAATLSGVSLAGVADANLTNAEEAVKYLRVPAFDDYQKLLPDVDAMIIATPTITHFEIAKACLLAGKHIMVEKPFTGNQAKAKELIALAEEKNLLAAAGLIERFNPTFLRLMKEIRGEKIIGLDIKRLSPLPERITDTDVIFDMMFHDIDLLNLIMPVEIETIEARGEKIRTKMLDRVVATLHHTSGAVSRIEASRVFTDRTRRITITCERNMVEADLLKKSIYIRDFSSPSPTTVPVKPADQITEELKNFVAAIRGKDRLKAPAAAALKAIELAERIKSAC